MYWRISRFPELGHLSEDDRDTPIRNAGGRRTYIRVIAQGVFFGLIFGIITAQTTPAAPWIRGLAGGAVLVVVAVGWYQFILWRMRIAMRLAIMDGLEGERVPTCLKCGYNSREASQDRCTECGAPLRVPNRTG